MNDEQKQELLALFDSGINQPIETRSPKRLTDLLRNDPEAQALYVEHCQIHAMLAWEHGTLDRGVFPDAEKSGLATTSPFRWHWLAIAASLLLISTVSWLWYSVFSSDQSKYAERRDTRSLEEPERGIAWSDREVIGTVARSRGANLLVPGLSQTLDSGDEVRAGRIQLTRGFVELSLVNGIEIVVESPTEFEFVSSMRMIVHSGRMSAKVSEQGHGFVVETPSARLVDYGTEFSVDVSDDTGSEVHVFDGEVAIRPKHSSPESSDLRLTANKATRIRGQSGIPEGIDIDHGRFVRSLRESQDKDADYMALVRRLKPTTWLRMPPPSDGVTLIDKGVSPTNAVLTLGEMKSPAFKPGQVGGALYLNGPTGRAYAKVPNYEPARGGTLSLCAWVRAESRPRWAAIAKHWAIEFSEDRETYSGLGGQFHFGLHEDDGDLEVQVRDEEGQIVKLREDVPLPLGQWHHVAFVVNGTKIVLYRNGVPVDSAPCQGLATDGPASLGIGVKLNPMCTGPNPTNPGYWHGRIDEMMCFETVLDEQQIAELCRRSRSEKTSLKP